MSSFSSSYTRGIVDLTSINDGDLAKASWCGGGGFGEVFVLEHKDLGKLAMKRLRETGSRENASDQRRRARREAETWQTLQHPNVLPFVGIKETPNHFYVVSQYAENGALNDYLRRHPETERVALLSDIASAMVHLHKKGIIHGDIKAANVLLSKDVRPLLCDFGLSRAVDLSTSTSLQGQGSIRWMSPELLSEGGGKTFASDAWAFGMLIYEVLSGFFPYYEVTNTLAIYHTVLFKKARPPKLPTQSPTGTSYSAVWDVAESCWNEDPERRPSMEMVHHSLPIVTTPSWVVLQGHSSLVYSVAFSADGQMLASASCDSTIRLWDPKTAAVIGDPLRGHMDSVWSVSWAPDGLSLVSGSDDTMVMLWDAHAGRPKGNPFSGHTERVQSVGYAPLSDMIASGSVDDTIRLWDPRTKDCIAVLEGHRNSVLGVAFSPNKGILATSSADKSIRMWDLSMRTQIGEALTGHTSWVRGIAFAPNGATLASGSDDHTIRLWDVVDSAMPKGDALMGHTGPVYSVAFAPDGAHLASSSHDRSVKLWELREGSNNVATLGGHSGWVGTVSFSPRDRWIASGAEDRTVRLWDASSIIDL